jgi:hypothetical protein
MGFYGKYGGQKKCPPYPIFHRYVKQGIYPSNWGNASSYNDTIDYGE